MTKDMLGAMIRTIVDFPLEMLKVIYDLIEKLSGENGQEWFAGLKNFLQKEKFAPELSNNTSLTLISRSESLVLDAVDGKETLASATDVFADIDSDFKIYGTDKKELPTEEIQIDVYEMEKDATFAQMFGERNADVRKLCLTQHQIKNAVKKHRKWLRAEGYATFFLFESNDEFFIADVGVYSDGELGVLVHRLGYSYVWFAEYRRRIIVPQLT